MSESSIMEFHADQRLLTCKGPWDLPHLPDLKTLLHSIHWPTSGHIDIDGKDIQKMDSAGAWLLSRLEQALKEKGLQVRLLHFSKQQTTLHQLVQKNVDLGKRPPPTVIPPWLQQLGMQTVAQCRGFMTYLAFVGELTGEALRISRHAGKWRTHAIAAIVYRSGYQALPIIALLSFMIGVVIAYQLGLQLRNYGANVYIVDLLGLSILREFGPLITAIMVAGRTGSAFTAQLGMMKLDREIDTLNTMGVTPAELLLLPRIIGLLIALPLLTFWADIFGVVGGMVMSSNMLGVTWYDFLHRFPRVIPLKTLFIGLGKAPLFALIISSVGCFEGMRVESNVNSIGLNTTRSVVSSIFFVIVVDAILSIIFSKLKL